MARCLIVGCGCRGRMLAEELIRRGYAVRGTSRDVTRVAEIEATGAEGVLADPDRIATMVPALAQVSAVLVLLGSALGEPRQLVALHGTRLGMLLQRTLDAPVRAIAYERVGTVDEALLREGAERVSSFSRQFRVACSLLEADPSDPETWVGEAAESIERMLGPR